MKIDILSPDEEKEARRLLPPASLPGGLAPTGRLVQGIRDRMARRARRTRLLRRAGLGLAACTALAALAAAFALGTGRAGCGGRGAAEYADVAEPREADGEAAAFLEYEKAFGSDPNEEAFEELDTLILALDFDFSTPDWQSL
jgi:hypothetical protein